jgi:hypothetical protein
MDAFLFFSIGKIASFENRGVAADILKKIASVIQQGLEERHLQQLPHS